jgi:hypothetical protein
MTHALSMPVSHHVAKREANLSRERLIDTRNAWESIVDDVLRPASAAFRKGDRLSELDFHNTVARARGVMSGLNPLLITEEERSPTRARPKGDAHEIGIVCRMGGGTSRFSIHGLAGMRVLVTRKRIDAEFEMGGVDATGHLMERAIQRELASWTGRLTEVDEALHAASGLAVVWRHAFSYGFTGGPSIAFPLGDGLMLGELMPSKAHVLARRVTINLTGLFTTDNGRSQFHAPFGDGFPDVRYLRAAFATAVDDNLLNLAQIDLRDALRGYVRDNAPLLDALGRAALFRNTVLTPQAGYDAMLPAIQDAARRLGDAQDLRRRGRAPAGSRRAPQSESPL